MSQELCHEISDARTCSTSYSAECNYWPRVLNHICQGMHCWSQKSLGQNEQAEIVDVDGYLQKCEDQPANEED